jgi:VanZ family protein
MNWLFALALLLIGYGSLYPFDFRAGGAPLATLLEPGSMSRGDLLGNVALFLPYGYLGMLAWRRPARPLRFVIVVVTAAAYGALLQCAQLYLPTRDPALRDVLPNAIGVVAGAFAGAIPMLDARRLSGGARGRSAPLLLALCWLAYRLVPFVPSLDWQEWKDSLKPLLEWSRLPWVDALHDAAAWAAVGCLWGAAPVGRLTVRWLPALVLATFCLEVVVVDNTLSAANVAGAALGLAAAALLRLRPAPVAVLLAAALVLRGLSPFEPRPEPQAFQWIPFGGFLDGSMLVNSQSLFEKTFLYGALVWLVREAGLRLAVAGGGVALLLACVEAAQTRLAGHTPEVTDPLLALFAALFLRAADPPRPPLNPVESRARKEELP